MPISSLAHRIPRPSAHSPHFSPIVSLISILTPFFTPLPSHPTHPHRACTQEDHKTDDTEQEGSEGWGDPDLQEVGGHKKREPNHKMSGLKKRGPTHKKWAVRVAAMPF